MGARKTKLLNRVLFCSNEDDSINCSEIVVNNRTIYDCDDESFLIFHPIENASKATSVQELLSSMYD
jgi:hypothetical protein